MRLLKDKNGKRLPTYASESTAKNRWKGVYFEEVFTGKAKPKTDDDYEQYQNWLHNKLRSDVKYRIESIAIEARRFIDENGEYEKGLWFETEFPDFFLRGEMDYKGLVHDNGLPPMSFQGILDAKLSQDITEVFDTGGATRAEKMVQVGIYSLADAYANSPKPELFDQAIALMKKQQGIAAVKKCEEFMEESTCLPGCYLIHEHKDYPKGKKAHHKMIVLEPDPEGYLMLYRDIYQKVLEINKILPFMMQYTPENYLRVSPNEHKCLGKGRMNEDKGRCPYQYECIHGRIFIGGGQRTTRMKLSNVWDS